MQRMKTGVTAVCVLGVLAVPLAARWAGAAKAPGKAGAERILPDVRIHEVTVSCSASPGFTHGLVTVRVVVKNGSTLMGTGPFWVKVETAEAPSGAFSLVGEQEAHPFPNPRTSAKVEMQTLYFNRSNVPVGTAYLYRTTIDSRNQIAEGERGETGNVRTDTFTCIAR
jgi:hypothetical protein